MKLITAPIDPITSTLRQVAGATAAVVLVLAPWLFAGTRGWAVDVLTALLALAGGSGLAAMLVSRRWPKSSSLVLMITLLGLIAIGVLGNLLRPTFPSDPFMVEQMRAVHEMIPGSFVAREPWRVWRFVAAALLATLAVAELARERVWWDLFFDTSAFAGCSIAILGLVQYLAHAPEVWWDTSLPSAGSFFGPFPHYTVAGAYLNLTWPLGFAFGLGLLMRPHFDALRQPGLWLVLGATALGLLALGCQPSRAAQALGVAILLLLMAVAWRWSRQRLGLAARSIWVGFGIAGLAAALAFWAISTLPLFETARGRWHELLTPPPHAETTPSAAVVWDSTHRGDRLIDSQDPTRGQFMWDRRLAWGTAWRMIEARPWLGYGLGGWMATYHHFTNDPFLKTFVLYMQFTHNSFLQTAVEWGVIGGGGWTVLWLGALWRGHQSWRRWCLEKDPMQAMKLLAVLLALSVLMLHACIEFPLEIPAILWQCLCFAALLWNAPGPTASRQGLRRTSHSALKNTL